MGYALIVASGALGLVSGSFANDAVLRWPAAGRQTAPEGAVCPSCAHPLSRTDGIPAVSYLLLRGRCRHCGGRLALRYLLVEIATGLIWAAMSAIYGLTWLLPALLAFAWALVVATAIDLEHRIIPNRLTVRLPILLLALLVVPVGLHNGWNDLLRGVIAGVAVPAAMLLTSELFRLLRGRAGIGMGDIKLAVSIGLVIGYLGGWHLMIWFYASVISSVLIAFGLILTGRAKLASRIPYGPYLALGSLTAVLGGDGLAGAVRGYFLG